MTYGVRDEFGAETTNIVKPLYHAAWIGVAARDARRRSRSAPMAGARPAAPAPAGGGRRSPTRAPASARRSAWIGPTSPSSSGPVLSEMPPGTTLRVELLADWRGSELRADVTAEQEAVHVRVWQDGVHALERGFNAPRRTDIDLLAEAIEAGGRDPVAVGHAAPWPPQLAGAGIGCRPARPPHERADRRHAGRPDACSLAAAERIVEILDVAIDDRGEAHWATTGGSTPAGDLPPPRRRRRCATRSTGGRSACGGPTSGSCPLDHPLSNAKIAFDRPARHRRARRRVRDRRVRRGRPGRPDAGRADPRPTTSIRSRPASAIGEGARPRLVRAPRYVEELRADGPDEDDDGWPAFDLIAARDRAGRPHPVGLPGIGGVRQRRAWALGVPAPTHVEPHVARVTLNPALVPARPRDPRREPRRGEGRDPARRPRPGRTSRAAARPSCAPPAGRDLDPRRSGGTALGR